MIKKRKAFAKELEVHYTKLSHLLNDKETPNLDFLYRLEIHSDKLISALLWWKLIAKKTEQEIKENSETRSEAEKKVEKKLVLVA